MPISIQNNIPKTLRDVVQRIEGAISDSLIQLGIEAEAYIRTNPDNWLDQTGNLRSSIGCVVANQQGVLFIDNFASVKAATLGANQGMALAMQVARQADKLTLGLVAGMEYACFVQGARDDFDKISVAFSHDVSPAVRDAINKAINEVIKK